VERRVSLGFEARFQPRQKEKKTRLKCHVGEQKSHGSDAMMRVLFCSSLLYLLDSQYIMPAQTDYSNHYNRSPSVSSSVGSHSGAIEDNTSLSDTELSQSDFARKCEEKIRLRYMTPQEEAANKDPRLPRPEDPEELMGAFSLFPTRIYSCVYFYV